MARNHTGQMQQMKNPVGQIVRWKDKHWLHQLGNQGMGIKRINQRDKNQGKRNSAEALSVTREYMRLLFYGLLHFTNVDFC